MIIVKRFTLILLLLILFTLFPIITQASQWADSVGRPIVQDQEYVPYDQWYGSDETIDKEKSDSESVVIPESPETDERTSPDEDWRPQAR